MNLLEETVSKIKDRGLTIDDVVYVGSHDSRYTLDWGAFAELAKSVNYDPGYGAQEIASDLVVLFKDGSWLERYEYDGSEEWHHRRAPTFKQGRPYGNVLVKFGEPLHWVNE